MLAACIAFGGLIGCDSGTRDKLGRLLGGGTAEQDQEQALLEQEKLWDIEELAQNRYGSVTLVYSPHDARVDMRLYKYAKDCTSSAGSPDALLECLKKPFDYTAAAEIQSIDNASLHLNRDAREIIESIPMQDMPIQEGNDALTMFWAYELQVEISREGYETQKFHFTGDRTRVGALGEDWQTRYWDMKGPGQYMVDFQGANLAPNPETAKTNYIATVREFECLRREVMAARDAGRYISEEQVNKVFADIRRKNGIMTIDDFFKIESLLRQTEPEWLEKFNMEIGEIPCN